jgi:glycosyltransferase involved in cell wall biosynthesis
MKTSLICTVVNEEKTIADFLSSILNQTKLPDEIIIADGGSKDNTIAKISNFQFPISKKKLPNIKLLFKVGNRSVGRNEAINKATGDIILISDAGCILEKNWVKNITASFSDKKVDVVAGFYKGNAENIFQKCLIPYVLVMEDKLVENDFLPATRSMALRKTIWKRVRKFDEKLSHNEDYAFANKLKKHKAKIVFCKDAVVNWIPRANLKQAFVMFFRFALGDAEAKIFRGKVIFIFLRYLAAIYLLILCLIIHSVFLWTICIFLALLYVNWTILKNYKYVNNIKAFIYLPLLQITSDIAVMSGTTYGLIKLLGNNIRFVRRSNNEFKKVIMKTIFVYLLSMAILFASFRKIRALIPPPEISEEKLVGYAQYFGYPLSYDTYIFIVIILLPIIILIFFSFKIRTNEKSN